MTSRRAVATLLVGLIALSLWWWPTDARRIRTQLHAMAEALGPHPPAAPEVERLAGVATLASGLAADVEVVAAGRTLRGRDAVLAAARALALAPIPLRVRLDDMQVEVSGDAARVAAVAVMDDDEAGDEYVEVGIDLARQQGDWRVTRVTERAPLERPDGRPTP